MNQKYSLIYSLGKQKLWLHGFFQWTEKKFFFIQIGCIRDPLYQKFNDFVVVCKVLLKTMMTEMKKITI